jgi:hypothetical protein
MAEKGGKEKIAIINGVGETRWRRMLDLFLKVDELHVDCANVFKL